jgi:hypothetical protein
MRGLPTNALLTLSVASLIGYGLVGDFVDSVAGKPHVSRPALVH